MLKEIGTAPRITCQARMIWAGVTAYFCANLSIVGSARTTSSPEPVMSTVFVGDDTPGKPEGDAHLLACKHKIECPFLHSTLSTEVEQGIDRKSVV